MRAIEIYNTICIFQLNGQYDIHQGKPFSLCRTFPKILNNSHEKDY